MSGRRASGRTPNGLSGSAGNQGASPQRGGRVLLAISGGIAACKTPELVRALDRLGIEVRCALTPGAGQFVSPLVLQAFSHHPVRSELFDLSGESEIDHIALADWADLVIVAPATAHLIARMAHGLADDLVTTLLLATRAPILLAPAMNVNMWRHPATIENVECLRGRGVHFVGPDAGALACGWEGEGRMSEPAVIAAEADRWLADPAIAGIRGASLAGERVLVTAGGTREPIDPVRAITNRSSGKMGFAIAAEAAQRGAEVVLVAGPVSLATPAGVRRVDVETALEMRDAVLREAGHAGITVMAAAVADFRPAKAAAHKIKKEDLADGEAPSIDLVRNPDILAELCARAPRGIVVGFAAESRDLLAAARRKLERKRCDLIVANDVSREGAGFDGDTNAVVLVWPGGDSEELPLSSKSEVAAMLWDRIESLRKPNA